MVRVFIVPALSVWMVACGPRACGRTTTAIEDAASSAPPVVDRREALRTPPLASARTTHDATLRPTHIRAASIEPRSPSDPEQRASLVNEGWGAISVGPGELSLLRRAPGTPSHRASSPPGKRLLRLAHVTDVHVVDDESPTRVVDYDGDAPFNGAFRPQEGYACRVLDAAARTINRLHADDPFDLVLFGGDSIDNAQDNELSWFLGTLSGSAPVACDSGPADDPVAGSSNDPKDPFLPNGLRPPWYWVTGNHDILVQGTFVPDAAANRRTVGDHAGGGTRDYTRPGAPVVRGSVVADAARTLLSRDRLLTRIGEHAPGDYAARSRRAFYSVDVGARMRIIVVDTAAETGGADGVLRREDVTAFVVPELARATADHRWVVLAAHHAIDHIGNGTSSGGNPREDAIGAAEWEAIASAPPVVALLVGHGHSNRVRRVGHEPKAVWELQTAALTDHPSTFRVIEVWDEGESLVLRATSVDYATDGDALAAEARSLAVLDWTTGWSCCGAGSDADRNVVLTVPLAAR